MRDFKIFCVMLFCQRNIRGDAVKDETDEVDHRPLITPERMLNLGERTIFFLAFSGRLR